MYQVVSREIDLAGKHKIRVIVSAEETMFLWFDTDPTQSQIDNSINNTIQERIVTAPPTAVQSSILNCSAWQFRKALNVLGIRSVVEAAVAASTDITVKDGWLFAAYFYRNDPFVIQFGLALGKTDKYMDDLFTLALTL
jgi:hypothetical protein